MKHHPFIVFCWLLLGLCCAETHAQEPAAKTAPETAEIQSVISTLENPEARDRLIGQLKLLVRTQQEMTGSHETEKPTLGSTTVDLLKMLSDRLAKSVETTVKAVTMFHEFPKVVDWLERQVSNLDRRNLWLSVIENLVGIMGSGYLAFFVVQRLLKHLREASLERRPADGDGWAICVVYLFVLLLLALLPVIAFAVVSYVSLGFVQPSENIRLVAIAWINAAIIVHVVVATARFFIAPHHPQFRFLPIGDETALYADSWFRWLAITLVYGYFALQAALLIGMPLPLYETLLRLLGLLVTGLLIVLILQNRRCVAQYIRGTEAVEARELHPRHILRRLASFWHVMAIIYVLMLYGIWALALTDGFLFILKGTLLTAALLIIGNSSIWLIERVFRNGFRFDEALRQRFPSLEQRFNRYLPILQMGVKGLVYLFMTLAVFQAWGISTFVWMTTGLGKTFSDEVVKIGGIVLITLLLWESVTLLIEGYLGSGENQKRKPLSARRRTLLSVAHNALFIVLIVMSTLIVLSELGINIAPLLAGAGVAGLAIGFGAQKLVQDIITGLFILFEDLISVGDVVSLGGKDGLVEAITIRTVRLRDLAGNVHTIPFSSIGPITNMTREFAYYVFDVGVSYQENIDTVMDELAAIGQEMLREPQYATLILEPLEILGVDSFASDAVMIKARIKTLPIKQWDVGREFNRRMKKRFDQLSIKMASSHSLTVYIGKNQKPDNRQSSQGAHKET
ncbi:MAG TPA: mechanosensitive ion channel domain-containing protein [Methylobacter sp.]|jgi:small conductance mechanosensitive channel